MPVKAQRSSINHQLSSINHQMTVLEVLTAATRYLEDHGVESPRLNAEHLLAHVLRKRRLDLYLEFDRRLSDGERAPLRELIRDRGSGKPLQHLLGTAEFCGRSFLSDERALIPRPETEQLVELILEDLHRRTSPMSILDVGTGSGVIAITLGLELPFATVTATDISAQALSLARDNASRHSFEARIAFFEADLFPPGMERFDCIVANLPYIARGNFPNLQAEVRHDPVTALDGGSDGLSLIRRLIGLAPARLEAEGILAMEIGYDQSPEVLARFALKNYRNIRLHNDYQGFGRFVLASSPQKL
jgi:release factor glutamine methyltransferase